MLSLDIKQEIIEKHECGVRVNELARQYGRNMLTISTILKHKGAIKAVKPPKGITIISKPCSPIIEEMERLLIVCIKDREIIDDTITETVICKKAHAIFTDLKEENSGGDAGESSTELSSDDFKASRG
ncbi:putative CENPB DNA-binding domain-containing protein 1 [Palaemon carinicauda]|uniref:putative CENPB DNA-binding domain-containing protein 1 n=1 Tax=Palaemon carinicauda TaxID=392227 RepID=UPI0035B698AC